MLAQINTPTTQRIQLLGKITWDIQLHLRKFMEVADKAMTNDLWHQSLSSETKQWIRDWYPVVKEWVKEFRQIEETFACDPEAAQAGYELLEKKFDRPDFRFFIHSAANQLNFGDESDDIGLNMSHRIARLGTIQRDVKTHNFTRLWMAEY